MEYARTKDAQPYEFQRASYCDKNDGSNKMATFAWCIRDNSDFGSYEQQYGLQLVNRTAPEVPRTHKRSIFDWVDIFHERLKASVTAPAELQQAA